MLAVVTAILLAAHLVLVGVAMMGPLFAVWLEWRGRRRGEDDAVELGRQLALCAVGGLLLGSVLGAILLALRYYADDGYFAAAAAIPTDRLWFALVELLFSLVCLVVYAGLWKRWQKARVLHRLVALAAATNLLAHFPALFVIISVISSRRPLPADALDRAAYQRLLIDGEVLSRVVHLWLAAGAITGMLLVLLALRKKGTGASTTGEDLVRIGARQTITFAMLQFPVGLWVALAMPARQRQPLLGGDALAALLFLSSLMLAMVLLHVVSPLAQGTIDWRRAWRAVATLMALILLMVSVRVRLSGLERWPVREGGGLSDGTFGAVQAGWPLRPPSVPFQ